MWGLCRRRGGGEGLRLRRKQARLRRASPDGVGGFALPNLPLPQTESGTSSEVPPYNAELTEKLCAHKTFAERNIIALINVSLIHINIVYNVYDS